MSASDPGRRASISVVVPFYDDQAALDRLLAAMELQTHTGPVRIVVADDGSRVPPILPRSRRYALHTVHQDDRGFRAAAARNLAVAAYPADLLVFLDADMVPEPGYLAAVVAALQHLDVVVGRRRHADLGDWSPSRIGEWLTGRAAPPRELTPPAWLAEGYAATANLADSDSRSYRYLISAVLAITAEMFDRIGGFDERFVGYGGEDWDLAHRCWLAGARWRYLPEAVAWHNGADLAGRLDADELAQVLDRQRERLTPLLPDPWFRRLQEHPGAHPPTQVPSVAVILTEPELPADSLELLVAGLAAGGEVHLWLDLAGKCWSGGPLPPGVHLGRPSPEELSRIPMVIDGTVAATRWAPKGGVG